jgi:hypothetical protein
MFEAVCDCCSLLSLSLSLSLSPPLPPSPLPLPSIFLQINHHVNSDPHGKGGTCILYVYLMYDIYELSYFSSLHSLVPSSLVGGGKKGNDCTCMRQNRRILSVDYLIVYYKSSSKVAQALEKYLAIG